MKFAMPFWSLTSAAISALVDGVDQPSQCLGPGGRRPV
jgi:hypothetical protein